MELIASSGLFTQVACGWTAVCLVPQTDGAAWEAMPFRVLRADDTVTLVPSTLVPRSAVPKPSGQNWTPAAFAMVSCWLIAVCSPTCQLVLYCWVLRLTSTAPSV